MVASEPAIVSGESFEAYGKEEGHADDAESLCGGGIAQEASERAMIINDGVCPSCWRYFLCRRTIVVCRCLREQRLSFA